MQPTSRHGAPLIRDAETAVAISSGEDSANNDDNEMKAFLEEARKNYMHEKATLKAAKEEKIQRAAGMTTMTTGKAIFPQVSGHPLNGTVSNTFHVQ